MTRLFDVPAKQIIDGYGWIAALVVERLFPNRAIKALYHKSSWSY